MKGLLKKLLLVLLRGYQLTFAAVLGGHCRFHPSCSHYAQTAIETHGIAKGLLLGLWRVARCGPFGRHPATFGFDPVPQHVSFASFRPLRLTALWAKSKKSALNSFARRYIGGIYAPAFKTAQSSFFAVCKRLKSANETCALAGAFCLKRREQGRVEAE